jgi:hypothetical protein
MSHYVDIIVFSRPALEQLRKRESDYPDTGLDAKPTGHGCLGEDAIYCIPFEVEDDNLSAQLRAIELAQRGKSVQCVLE